MRHETLADLSGLPVQVVDAIKAALKGTALVPAGEAVTITRSVPHGHVAAVHAMAVKLGLPALLGPACPLRDLALAPDHLPGRPARLEAVHAGLVDASGFLRPTIEKLREPVLAAGAVTGEEFEQAVVALQDPVTTHCGRTDDGGRMGQTGHNAVRPWGGSGRARRRMRKRHHRSYAGQ